MKKLAIISGFTLAAIVVISCNDVQRKPSRTYMPDMAYSRAYETYSDHSNLASKGINYNSQPVLGTVSRGEEMPYRLPNDSNGYNASRSVANPIPKMNNIEIVEAERLYLINCAICHGTALDGNGPLYKGGQGPYPAKPATLVGDPKIESLPDGTLYHVMTYGKGMMGSYAAQLNRKQRWMVAQYIKSKQAKSTGTNPLAAVPQGDTVKPKTTITAK
jgi:mono/diheme cytochrome c family protein